MDGQIEDFESFNYCEGIDRFILEWDKGFIGEYAMIAARNETPSCFYDELRPMVMEARSRMNPQGSHLIFLRLENRFGVVKSRFILGSFPFDECCRLAMECGRKTFLYATRHEAPCEYDCQTGEPVFKGDFRRTLAHWLLPHKTHEIFTVAREVELNSLSGYALSDKNAREKMWKPIFELSNKRLPLKGPRVISINERFIWHADTYKGWSDFLRTDEIVTILPYRGWTPELLIGDEKEYFEIWKKHKPEDLLQPGELCIYGMGGGIPSEDDANKPLSSEYYENRKWFSVCRKNEETPFKIETLQDRMTLTAACSFLLGLKGNNNTFSPKVVCSKGRGILKALMDDPQSTFIIVSCWKPCRQKGDKCVPVDATENIYGYPPVLDLFEHIDAFPQDKNLRGKNKRKLLVELQKKVSFSTLKLRCGGRSIDSREPLEHNPCWNYITWDYVYDSVCFVLKPGYSREGFDALKKAVIDRLASLDVEALFVKEREECYVLGCRSKEITLKYLGDSSIRFQKNRGERLPLNVVERLCRPLGEKVRISLFSFLHKLYNHGRYGFAEVNNLPDGIRTQINVPYIEEEIYRGNNRVNGMAQGMVFSYGCRPLLRSQWERIKI